MYLLQTVYNLRLSTQAVGDEKYAQARFSAKRANGLASRYAGLGIGATLKSKPKPEKARLRWRKPVLQAENVTLAGELRLNSNTHHLGRLTSCASVVF
jgi:hypothetical protein